MLLPGVTEGFLLQEIQVTTKLGNNIALYKPSNLIDHTLQTSTSDLNYQTEFSIVQLTEPDQPKPTTLIPKTTMADSLRSKLDLSPAAQEERVLGDKATGGVDNDADHIANVKGGLKA